MRAQETATTWWLTGLPGAGKTTLAQALARALRQRGKPVCVIDGDELRAGLCQDLGFDDASRAENVRRAAHMARLLNDNAIHGVVAMVSPAVDARAAAYATIGLQRCKEIGGAQFQYIGPLEHNSPLLLSAYAGAKLFVLPSTLER